MLSISPWSVNMAEVCQRTPPPPPPPDVNTTAPASALLNNLNTTLVFMTQAKLMSPPWTCWHAGTKSNK